VRPGTADPYFFGRFLNMLQAEQIVVVNSRLGLEAVARHGRGLSHVSRLTCAYFRMGTYSDFFPRRTAPFALTLTDNEPMAEKMRRLHGHQPGPGIRILPPRLPATDEATFESRVAARRARSRTATTLARWCWISRIAPTKGLDILRHIASLRPTDEFDVFGPLEGSLQAPQPKLKNLRYRGVIMDVAAADFTDYDGFLFASYDEGMPNVVLEMSQHAIPMVLTRVGGLSQTFTRGVRFIDHASDSWHTAKAFSAALDEIIALEPAEIARMTEQARACALERHSAAVFKDNVKKIFGSSWPTST
jgi:glycosyltransferase involved in cell wall biosynthesis